MDILKTISPLILLCHYINHYHFYQLITKNSYNISKMENKFYKTKIMLIRFNMKITF